MTKIRVHEYAKLVKKTSKEVIEELGKLNVNVTNHMSTIDKDAVSKLDKSFGGNKEARNTKSAIQVQNLMQDKNQSQPSRQVVKRRTKSSSSRWSQIVQHQGGQNRPASRWRIVQHQVDKIVQLQSDGGQNVQHQGGQNRPASTGTWTSRPTSGGQNRPASTGWQNRPA